MISLFLSVLNISLTASFIIVAVIFVRVLLKKAPKVISYALWAAVGVRLVMPFTFENISGLFQFKAAPIPLSNNAQSLPSIDGGITVVNNINTLAPAPATVYNVSINPVNTWLEIGAYIWLIGMCVMLIYTVMSVIMLKRKLKNAVYAGDNLYEAEGLKTPFVLGLFIPKIYIPAELKETDRRYVIVHEQMHIRRLDHLVKFVSYLILCLHWFNPLVWSAFLLMGMDMEMCCDERVLKEMSASLPTNDDGKAEYSKSLLSMAIGRHIISGSPLAFGEGNIKERVKNVLIFKKHSRTITTASICLILCGLLVFTIFFNFNFTFAKAHGKNLTDYFALHGIGRSDDFMEEAFKNNFFVSLDEPVISTNNGITMSLNRYIITAEHARFVFKVNKLPENTLVDNVSELPESYILTPAGQMPRLNFLYWTLSNEQGELLQPNQDIHFNGFADLYKTTEGIFFETVLAPVDLALDSKINNLEIPDRLSIEMISMILVTKDYQRMQIDGPWNFELPVDDKFKNVNNLYYDVINPEYCEENGVYVENFYSSATTTRMELTIDNSKNNIQTDSYPFLIFDDPITQNFVSPVEQKLFIEADGELLFDKAYPHLYYHEIETPSTKLKFGGEDNMREQTDRGTKYFIYLPTLYFANAKNVTVRILDEDRQPIDVKLHLNENPSIAYQNTVLERVVSTKDANNPLDIEELYSSVLLSGLQNVEYQYSNGIQFHIFGDAIPKEVSVAPSGSLSTSDDGKYHEVWLNADAEMSVGHESWEKGDDIIFEVESSDVFEAEIGIIAVSDSFGYNEMYSEKVDIGSTKKTVSIIVPNDGDYGIYFKNYSSSEVSFIMTANRELLSLN